jgi:hypothetical protein
MPPLLDPVDEGRRVAEAAAEAGTPLRLLGGVAVALRCPSSQAPPLSRSYADIDFGTVAEARDSVVDLIGGLGYRADREFNTLHGHRRLIFWDEANQRHLDVFVEEADLCHRISLRDRIGAVPLTLPLADLVVLKLQVVETNEKDYLDLCALFTDHDLSDDESGINVAYIAHLTASDWGLWRTLGMVAERAERFARELAGFERGEVVAERLTQLRQELDSVPKTRGWKLRARIGERKRWYELPEEVH